MTSWSQNFRIKSLLEWEEQVCDWNSLIWHLGKTVFPFNMELLVFWMLSNTTVDPIQQCVANGRAGAHRRIEYK